MKITLKDIAVIQTGVFAKTAADGDIVYLQAKHFGEDGMLQSGLFPDLKADTKYDKHILRSSDVIFAAKGTKNFAAVYKNSDIPAVASTSFFVIRIKNDSAEQVLPEYLVWYLNLETTMSYIKSKATGTAIASVSKLVLDELEIPVTNIRNQQIIVKLSLLRQKEKMLKTRIDKLTEARLQKILINAVK